MRWKPWLIGGVACFLLLGGLLLSLCVFRLGGTTNKTWGNGVAVIPVNGTIVVADEIVERIEDARKAERVKAVVLRVNSPGGSVGASQEIYQALLKLNKEKPVVTSMGDVAASGGYYIACATQRIFAMPGTITASIGVRMSHWIIGDLLRWAKITPDPLKSGALKESGSIYRPMTPEERDVLQGILTDMHAQFKEAVATGRKLSAAQVDAFADGRALTGRQAMALKLIDDFGGLPEAVAAAGVLGGIAGEPKVIELKKTRPWWIDFVWGDAESGAQRLARFVADLVRGPSIGYWVY